MAATTTTVTQSVPDDAATASPALVVAARSPAGQLLTWVDAHRYWILAAILLLYAAGFNGQWRFGADTTKHALLATNLYHGQGYEHTTGVHRGINPGLPHLMALSFRLFGEGQVQPVVWFMFALGLGGLGLAYLFFHAFAGRPVAIVCTVLLAVSELYYRYAFHVLTETPFIVGLLAFLLGFERWQQHKGSTWLNGLILLGGVLMMAAFRSVVLVVLAAVALFIVWQVLRQPRRGRYVVLAVVVLAAFLAVRSLDPRLDRPIDMISDEAQLLERFNERRAWMIEKALTVNLVELVNEHITEAVFAVDLGRVASIPVSLLLIGLGLALFRRRPLWGLIVLAFLAQWILFAVTRRYLLVLMPLLAVAWWQFAAWASARFAPNRGRLVLVFLLLCWIVPNGVYVGRFIVEQRQSPFLEHYNGGRYQALMQLSDAFAAHVGPDDVVFARYGQEMTYFTGRSVLGSDQVPLHQPHRQRTRRMVRDAPALWVVTPLDGGLRQKLARLNVTWSASVASAAQPDGQVVWDLRRATYTPPPRPAPTATGPPSDDQDIPRE